MTAFRHISGFGLFPDLEGIWRVERSENPPKKPYTDDLSKDEAKRVRRKEEDERSESSSANIREYSEWVSKSSLRYAPFSFLISDSLRSSSN